MALGINFAGNEIPGLFGSVQMSPRVLQTQRTKFFGVHNVSELTGGKAERGITVQFWLFDEYPSPLLASFAIDQLDLLTGVNGALVFNTATAVWSLYDCTYDGQDVIQLPMLDIAGTMDGGYWAELLLHFTQLSGGE